MFESLTVGSVRIRLLFTSPKPETFREVRVFDRFGSRLDLASPGSCVTIWEASTPLIPRETLPLFCEADACEGFINTPRDFNGPLLPELATPPDVATSPATCIVRCEDNAACNRAVNDGLLLQDQLAVACDEWRRTRDRADERERELAVMVAVFIVLLLLVAIGLFLGPFGWIVAGAAGVAAAALGPEIGNVRSELEALRRRQRELETQLEDLRPRLRDLIAAAERACCPGCGPVFPIIPC